MKIILYGNRIENTYLEEMFCLLPCLDNQTIEWEYYHEFEDFRENLVEHLFDLVIITTNGDQGKVACELTRKLRPKIPLFWFSDNRDFWHNSYQLNCTYFSTKPILAEKLGHAFERYENCCRYIV